MRYTSCIVLPIREHAFFEQTILHQQLRYCFFQTQRFLTQVLYFIGRGFSSGIPGQTFLARLQRLLAPVVIQILVDPLFAAQFSNAAFTA